MNRQPAGIPRSDIRIWGKLPRSCILRKGAYHDLVDRLGVLGEIVPEGGRVVITRQVGGRVSLLGVDEVGEFCRVSD
jgi:hypothetical protein